MSQVYATIKKNRAEEMQQAYLEGKDHFRYDFEKFCADMRRKDFITTKRVLKDKWDNAISDGVIIPLGLKEYSQAVIQFSDLAKALHLSEEKMRVCVCLETPYIQNDEFSSAGSKTQGASEE